MAVDDNVLELPVENPILERQAQLSNAKISANDVKIEDVKWLWENYIQAERLGLLIGDGSIGKGMLTSWLFAQLSHGDLPGDLKGKPVRTLFISSEEVFESETVPRLMAQEADLKQISFIDDEKFQLYLDEIGSYALAKMLSDDGIDLVHIDPIINYFPPGKKDNEIDVYSVLRPLGRAAKEFGVTVVGLRHTPKASHTMEDIIMGSKAWRNAARSALGLFKHPEDTSLRIAISLKTNNAAEDIKGQCYKIESVQIPGLQKGVGKLIWTGESYSKDELDEMRGKDSRERDKITTEKDSDRSTVENYFGKNGGEVSSKKALQDLMDLLGKSKPTVYRLMKRLDVDMGKQGDPNSVWKLTLDSSGTPLFPL